MKYRQILHKIYLSLLVLVSLFSGGFFLVNTAFVVHDTWFVQHISRDTLIALAKIKYVLSTEASQQDKVDGPKLSEREFQSLKESFPLQSEEIESNRIALTVRAGGEAPSWKYLGQDIQERYLAQVEYWGPEGYRNRPILSFFWGFLFLLPPIFLMGFKRWTCWLVK